MRLPFNRKIILHVINISLVFQTLCTVFLFRNIVFKFFTFIIFSSHSYHVKECVSGFLVPFIPHPRFTRLSDHHLFLLRLCLGNVSFKNAFFLMASPFFRFFYQQRPAMHLWQVRLLNFEETVSINFLFLSTEIILTPELAQAFQRCSSSISKFPRCVGVASFKTSVPFVICLWERFEKVWQAVTSRLCSASLNTAMLREIGTEQTRRVVRSNFSSIAFGQRIIEQTKSSDNSLLILSACRSSSRSQRDHTFPCTAVNKNAFSKRAQLYSGWNRDTKFNTLLYVHWMFIRHLCRLSKTVLASWFC